MQYSLIYCHGTAIHFLTGILQISFHYGLIHTAALQAFLLFLLARNLLFLELYFVAGILIFLLGFIKHQGLKLLRRRYWNIISWIFVFVFLIQTSNCFILYHASTFASKYINTANEQEYGFEELYNLREHIVAKLNNLSTQFERDNNGEIIFDGDLYSECIESMKQLGKNIQALLVITHSLKRYTSQIL